MPLSLGQEELRQRLEKKFDTSDAAAAALIRQLAIEVDDLWDRLSRVYAFLRGESSEDPIQQEIQELRELLQQPREVQ